MKILMYEKHKNSYSINILRLIHYHIHDNLVFLALFKVYRIKMQINLKGF